MNAGVTHIPRILQWNISSSWYCTLIVSFTNFNCNSRVMCCKDSFKGTHCNRMFCDLWISNSFASFINHQCQNIQSSKLSGLEKKVSLLIERKFPSLLYKYGIQRMIIIVDRCHISNVCTMKAVKAMLTHVHTSLWRKWSKVVNFPLR